MTDEPLTPSRGWIRVEPNPILVASHDELGQATISWSATTAVATEVRIGAPDGPLFARAAGSGCETTGRWLRDGLALFLQDASDGRPDSLEHTIANAVVRVNTLGQRSSDSLASVTAKPTPPVGAVDFGDLRRSEPIGADWGFTRGRPIDRYYIERFLERNAATIHGRVLEFGNDAYTRRFGGSRVVRSDVMNVQPDIPGTTIRADLTDCGEIADATFDCVICTQVLQLIYDLPAAVRQLHRLLRPGGRVLATVCGISCSYVPAWGHFQWSLTPISAKRLFEAVFPEENVHVEGFGNLLGGIAFLAGTAVEDLREGELDLHTIGYEVVIAVSASKAESLSRL